MIPKRRKTSEVGPMTSPAALLASSQATARERKKLVGSGARIRNRASVLSSALTCCPQRPASSPVEGEGTWETQVQLLPLSLPGHVTPDGQNRRLMLLGPSSAPVIQPVASQRPLPAPPPREPPVPAAASGPFALMWTITPWLPFLIASCLPTRV